MSSNESITRNDHEPPGARTGSAIQPQTESRDSLSKLVYLTREVRLSAEVRNGRFWIQPNTIQNSWSGHTTGHKLAPQISLRATVCGTPDETAGYVCDVATIASSLLAAAERSIHGEPATTEAPTLLRGISERLLAKFSDGVRLHSVTMLVSPYLKYVIETRNPAMVLISQQFEFSAAHRLHSPKLSDDENRRIYGKCNHPSGHGHNYRVDVTLLSENDASGFPVKMRDFESTVRHHVIARFDHKHLDKDCVEFSQMPSTVENIATVIWLLLNDQFPSGALHNVRVFETPKTWADVGVQTS